VGRGEHTAPQEEQLLEPSLLAPHLGQSEPCMFAAVCLFADFESFFAVVDLSVCREVVKISESGGEGDGCGAAYISCSASYSRYR
jgi:hypothetical protein